MPNIKLPQIVFVCITVLVIAGCENESSPVMSCEEWGYGQDNGPSEWGRLCSATCSATRQSPIDIVTSEVEDIDLTEIEFDYSSTLMELFNNGHTIELADEQATKTNSITIDGNQYDLLQFHFHALSEHTVDGQHSPIEMHLVHSLSSSKLAVIGVMIEQGESNPALSAFWSQLPPEKPTDHAEVTVDLENLLPTNREYYQYDGSLTTPNGSNPEASCAEIVNWVVMKDAITMSEAQITAFQSIFDHNYRPVQPLNGRVVSR